MRAAKQPTREDEPLDKAPLADKVDALEEAEEAALEEWPADEEAYKLDAQTQGLVNKLYYRDEEDENEDW
jgi:hypothetical protein